MPIPPWTVRKNWSRSAHQEIVDEVNAQDNITGIDPILVQTMPQGKTVSADALQPRFIEAIGVIIAPENGDYAYGDPRYRVRLLVVHEGTKSEDLLKFQYEDNLADQPEGGTDPSSTTGIDQDAGFTVTATHLSEIQDFSTGAGTHTLREDSSVVVHLYAFYDRVVGESLDIADHLRWFFTVQGVGSSLEIGIVTTQYSGRAYYGVHITKPPVAKEWVPIIVGGSDVQTVYTSGGSITNGDYAKNLSDGIVYHRVGGAWVNAAGHLTDSDVDITVDGDTTVSMFFGVPVSTVHILVNLYELIQGNAETITSPLLVGELVLMAYRSTNSNGTKVYVCAGRFRFTDPTATYHGIYGDIAANTWGEDYVRSHA